MKLTLIINHRISAFFFSRNSLMPHRCSRTLPPPNSYTLLTRPSRKSRSWLTTMRVPSKSLRACFKISFVLRSRWLVGSSSMSRLTGSRRSFIMHRRTLSPPDNTFTFFLIFFATKHESTQQIANFQTHIPYRNIIYGLEHSEIFVK